MISARNLLGSISRAALAALALTVFTTAALAATSRIKDIADFEGIRDNMLVGYGLVVGLNGTGDTLANAPFTRQSLEAMLERLGVNVRNTNLKPENVAAVMVTATLPAFARHGSRLDVTVSALGDANDLRGGTLLVTPLMGADGEVYAVSQGSVATGGFSAGGDAGNVTKGVPTNGQIPNGAIIEREVGFELATLSTLNISLRNPDLTTSRRVAQSINAFLNMPAAEALDPGTIRLGVPENYLGNPVALLSAIEQLMVETDQPARVIINERTGVIVIGEDVRVDTVAIAQGNLTIRVTEAPQVSQPQPFAQQGQTTVVPRTDVEVEDEPEQKLTLLERGVTLQELVDGLNALGVGPQDMISILQAIKAAGALQADIEVM